MYLTLKRYRPHFQITKQLKQVSDHLEKIQPLIEKIQNQDEKILFNKELKLLNENLLKAKMDSILPNNEPKIFDKCKADPLILNIRTKIDLLVAKLEQALSQQELRLKRLQEALEQEKLKQAQEEAKRKEQEELRRKKAELEERKRIEMEQQLQREKLLEQQTNIDNGNMGPVSLNSIDMSTMFNEEERQRQIEYFKRLEQERRDYELALRLSQDGSGTSTGILFNDDVQQPYTVLIYFSILVEHNI